MLSANLKLFIRFSLHYISFPVKTLDRDAVEGEKNCRNNFEYVHFLAKIKCDGITLIVLVLNIPQINTIKYKL